jgi:hypothetical protein
VKKPLEAYTIVPQVKLTPAQRAYFRKRYGLVSRKKVKRVDPDPAVGEKPAPDKPVHGE